MHLVCPLKLLACIENWLNTHPIYRCAQLFRNKADGHHNAPWWYKYWRRIQWDGLAINDCRIAAYGQLNRLSGLGDYYLLDHRSSRIQCLLLCPAPG